MPRTVNVNYVTKEVKILLHDSETESLAAATAIAAAESAQEAKDVVVDNLQDSLDAIDAKTETEKTELDGYTETKKTEIATLGQGYVDSASQKVAEANTILSAIRNEYGYPFTAATAAAMTDSTKIYIYTGSETGYTNGDWYYYNGTAWVSGGIYNAVAFETDPTLTISDAAADAKVTGNLISNINKLTNTLPVEWESGGVNATTGGNSDYVTSRRRCGYISVFDLQNKGFTELSVKVDAGYKVYGVVINNAKTEVVHTFTWTTKGITVDLTDYPTNYLRFMYSTTSDTQPSDDTHIHCTYDSAFLGMVGDVNMLKEDVEVLADNDVTYIPKLEKGSYSSATGEPEVDNTGVRWRYVGMLKVEEILNPASMVVPTGYMVYVARFTLVDGQYSFIDRMSIGAGGKLSNYITASTDGLKLVVLKSDYTVSTEEEILTAFKVRMLKDWWVGAQGESAIGEKGGIYAYFGQAGYPTLDIANTTKITLTDKNLIIYDSVGAKTFLPSDILTAASAYASLTVDTVNRTISGSEFIWVYNTNSRTISFRSAYAKMDVYDVPLYIHMYTSYEGGLLYETIMELQTRDNTTRLDSLIAAFPSYYGTQMAQVKANYLNDLEKAGRNGDSFIFITDSHWEGNYKHSPALIKNLVETADVNTIISGGDLIDGSETYYERSAEYLRKHVDLLKKAGVPLIVAKGNHDRNSGYGTWSPDVYFSDEKYFALAQQPTALDGQTYGGDCYFYWDKVSTKTRYIVLDSGVNYGGDEYDITAAQITWAAGIIDVTPADWHIIIVVHSLGGYSNMTVPVEDPSQYFTFTTGASALLDMLDNKLSTHSVEAVFFGHTHFDAVMYSTGGIPLISTNSDAKWQYWGMPQPSDGTVEAQCFDVVTMDYTAKKIYLRRVGRGEDRTVTYGE